jgi:Fe-S-cluster containining protein
MAPSDRAAFLGRLRQLFAEMDAAYARAAAAAGFDCRGCEESCCRSVFHHHTFIEALLLREGLRSLEPGGREEVLVAARTVADAQAASAGGSAAPRPMCPLNLAGRCRLYEVRPMICRLHGVAHELHPPGRPVVIGPGCAEYERCRGSARAGERFDRTPFYARLAVLESEFRATEGLQRRIKLTVAEMLLAEVLP